MHCWMLSTYDKYQQRLSWLSAQKQALAIGHRINIDTGRTFSRKTWKITSTTYTSTTKFYKVHITSLVPFSNVYSWWRKGQERFQGLSNLRILTSMQQCFRVFRFCSDGCCPKSNSTFREVTARKGNMKLLEVRNPCRIHRHNTSFFQHMLPWERCYANKAIRMAWLCSTDLLMCHL